jgi:hypothetical protein
VVNNKRIRLNELYSDVVEIHALCVEEVENKAAHPYLGVHFQTKTKNPRRIRQWQSITKAVHVQEVTAEKSIRKHVYSLAESLAREGIQQKLQDALEAERDDIVGRARYERVGSPVYRNGYHKMRCLVCGCGTVHACLTAVRYGFHAWKSPMSRRLFRATSA